MSIGLQAVGEEAISGQTIMDPLEANISLDFPWLLLNYAVQDSNRAVVTQRWPSENTPQVFNGVIVV